MRYGKFLTDQTDDVEDIAATSDGGEYTDEVLRKLNFYPIETIGENTGNCRMSYTLVDDDNGGHIEELFIPMPREPAKYSKLKILLAAQQTGMGEAFINLLESNTMLKLIWDASNTIEDNELLDQYLPTIGQAIGKTPEEIKEFLDENCVVDE